MFSIHARQIFTSRLIKRQWKQMKPESIFSSLSIVILFRKITLSRESNLFVYDKSGIKLEMAENINEQLEGIGFVNLGVKARPGLVVLRRTKMPAVLVEVGFINSDTDNMLFDDNFSDIALAIAEGILDTLGINTPVVPLPDENEAPVAPLPDENTYPDDAFPNEDNVPVVPLPPRYTVQTGAFRNPPVCRTTPPGVVRT